MNKWVTKKNVIWASGLGGGLFVFVLFALLYNFCGPYRYLCKDVYIPLIYVFPPLPFVFLFSLITYRMKQDVFDHWMGFAIWATPTLIFLTFLINGGGNNGFGVEGVIGGGFDAMLYMILYGLYCGISLWRIVDAYKAK